MSISVQKGNVTPAPAVLENFCYVEPEHSPCTQLANLCAYIARRWLQNPSAP